MEELKTENFLKWAEESRWLKTKEIGTDKGQQESYITPAGEFVIAQYDLKKQFVQLLKPIFAPPQATTVGRFPIDLRGSGQFPGLGGPPK